MARDTLISAALEQDGDISFALKSDSDRPLSIRLSPDDAFAILALSLLKLTELGARQNPPAIPLLNSVRWKIEPVPGSDQMMFSFPMKDGANVGHTIHRDQAVDMMLAIAIAAGLPVPEVPSSDQN